jgi:hypothetical protein
VRFSLFFFLPHAIVTHICAFFLILSSINADWWQVIQENSSGEIEQVKLPLLVYVSREKRPSHLHHFKAGALNALVRLSMKH